MRHVILTCRNHPQLRWSCKDIAFTDSSGYNGMRLIEFLGLPTGKGMYEDLSGLDCDIVEEKRNEAGQVTGYDFVQECTCAASDLIRAPEDSLVKRHE